ncbi:MAG: hypothetical protein II536_04575 [Clostridia bacterium]|nr:hypothetical protein [Clostridia bacterium]
MKKYCLIAALALLAATLCFACGCLHNDPGNTTPIDIPTSEPTQVPTLADPALIDAYLGDWYGVYTVGEAAGVFVPNANVSNDCAMRVAVDGYGRGVCSLTVNGMGRDAVSGSSNVFALCTAEVMQDGLHVDGMINRMPVEWAFTRDGNLLMMQGRCGTDTDYMVISIALARPDVIFSTPLVLAAREYLESAGFMGVVEKLGGSNDELPAVTPPEGYPSHVFFTEDSAGETASPDDGRTVTSADGHITLHLPDGYFVRENTVMDFIITSPEKGVDSAEFTVSSWSTDSLSFLLGNTPNVSELYHYTIDGFDFYGTFLEGTPSTEGPASTVFKLCGTNGTGTLIIINLNFALDAYSAYSYVNVENADFTELILGAKLSVF